MRRPVWWQRMKRNAACISGCDQESWRSEEPDVLSCLEVLEMRLPTISSPPEALELQETASFHVGRLNSPHLQPQYIRINLTASQRRLLIGDMPFQALMTCKRGQGHSRSTASLVLFRKALRSLLIFFCFHHVHPPWTMRGLAAAALH